MERKEKRLCELGLCVRSGAFLLILSGITEMGGGKWAANSAIEQLVISPIVWLTCFVLAVKFEGLRASGLFSILSELWLQLLSYNESQELLKKLIGDPVLIKGSYLLALLIVAIQAFLYFHYPSYGSLNLTGSKNVGYIIRVVNSTPIAIFYPTDQPYNPSLDPPTLFDSDKSIKAIKFEVNKTNNNTSSQSSTASRAFFGFPSYVKETTYLASKYTKEMDISKVPEWFTRFCSKGLFSSRRLGVHPEANLYINPDREMPVMVFSHGLGSHPNLHASLCKDLASKGVIVLVPQHADGEVFKASEDQNNSDESNNETDSTSLQWFIGTMKLAITKRTAELNDLIAFALSDQFAGIFPGNNVNPQVKLRVKPKIIISGHSLGGETALNVSLENPSTYATFILDPTMVTFEDNNKRKLLERQLSKPTIILCSEDFDSRMPFFNQRENIQLFLNAQKQQRSQYGNEYQYRQNILTGELQAYGHCSFFDVCLMIPRELKTLRKDIIDVDHSTTQMILLNKLAEFFIKAAHAEPADDKKNNDGKQLDKEWVPSLLEIPQQFEALVKALEIQDNPLKIF